MNFSRENPAFARLGILGLAANRPDIAPDAAGAIRPLFARKVETGRGHNALPGIASHPGNDIQQHS